MKKIGIIITSLLLMMIWSCNEDEWLKEEPLSFYTTENSYTTTVQFRQALNFLYDYLREMHWVNGDQTVVMYFGDLAYGGTDYPDQKFNNLDAFLTPTTYVSETYWDRAYISISNANTILNRIELTNQVSDDDKEIIKGEALFFRALWYNFLANLYGGVPITLEEESSPRRDYEKATRQSVYEQARSDLEEAIGLLPDIDDVSDGMVSLQAAQHLLTEVYISLGNYTAAINTAGAVIDHPSMGLMTSRFGSRADEPGDPYWDLFQYGNQNRESGNTESILVFQYEYKNSGSGYSLDHPRFLLPFYWNINVEGTDGGEVLAFTDFTENKGGRGIGVIHPTDHFLYDIWNEDGTDDYRNSPYIIARDFKIDNPDAAGFGEWIVADGWLQDRFKLRHFYPFVLKFCRTSNLPDDAYARNNDGSIKTTALGEKVLAYSWGSLSANSSLKDEYFYRLAETYLLRAEAYLKNDQPDMALNDINILRNRANATPAQMSDIDMDYILDERMRELYFEKFRLVTLCRMGKLVERAREYNPTGYNVGDHQNLFPIPYSAIETNISVEIEQNPGY
jgi:hypothetical protein